MKHKLSKFKLILYGHLLINIPVIVIIFVIRGALVEFVNLKSVDGGVIGIICGWTYWSYSIKKWIRLAFRNGYEFNELFSIGRANLFLWNKSTISNSMQE